MFVGGHTFKEVPFVIAEISQLIDLVHTLLIDGDALPVGGVIVEVLKDGFSFHFLMQEGKVTGHGHIGPNQLKQGPEICRITIPHPLSAEIILAIVFAGVDTHPIQQMFLHHIRINRRPEGTPFGDVPEKSNAGAPAGSAGKEHFFMFGQVGIHQVEHGQRAGVIDPSCQGIRRFQNGESGRQDVISRCEQSLPAALPFGRDVIPLGGKISGGRIQFLLHFGGIFTPCHGIPEADGFSRIGGQRKPGGGSDLVCDHGILVKQEFKTRHGTRLNLGN